MGFLDLRAFHIESTSWLADTLKAWDVFRMFRDWVECDGDRLFDISFHNIVLDVLVFLQDNHKSLFHL